MSFFNRLKIKRNKQISYYRFPAKSFTSEKIANICLQTKIDNFFIEIYGLQKNEIDDMGKILFDNGIYANSDLVNVSGCFVASIPAVKTQWFLIYIARIDFDEILIWDCYTTIEQFLKNKLALRNVKNENNYFFLDYNRYENGFAELYLDPTIDSQNIENIFLS